MFSPDSPDEVLTELGDKFLQSLVTAVAGTRDDLDAMREWRPSWFPTMSDRCLANLIHDRLWTHMLGSAGEEVDTTMFESGATREVTVGQQFRLRLKRHHVDDRVSNYPTLAAREFWMQRTNGVLPGMEEITLAAGYRWHADTKSIGAPVVSYRDGQENVIWAVELLGGTSTDEVTPIAWSPMSTPDLPVIDVTGIGDEDAADTGTDGAQDET